MRTNLERFIVERLLELDPTLSDAAGSAIYSTVVDPLVKRLGTDPMSVDIEKFITSRLADEFPNLDGLSPGSVFRDMFVLPLIMILEPLRAEVDFARKQHSLSDVDALAEEEMDALLDNIFAVRAEGDYSRTSVRLFFTAPQAFSVDSSIVFHTATDVEFIPEEQDTFLASDLSRSGAQYYIDIPVRSVLQTADAQVGVDTIKFVRGMQGVARVTNLTASSGGVSPEDNFAFVSRAQQALTERSLNTKRGIETGLRNAFEGIVSLDVVGYGEPEMQRDVLQGNAVIEIETGPGAFVGAAPVVDTPAAVTGLAVTNRIVVTEAAAGIDLSAVAVVGNYLRVASAGGVFEGVLSRPRRIASVTEAPAGQFNIILEDFEVFGDGGPLPAAPFTFSNIANVDPTLVSGAGFNRYARQGAQYSMVVQDGGTDYVIGAPLPFDEQIYTDAANGTLPTVAIPGRDFMVLQIADADPVTFGPQPSTRVYPIHQVHSNTLMSLSRLDSFMTARQKVASVAPADFTFDPNLSLMAESEGVRVVAFGAPKMSVIGAGGARTDGISFETFGRAPGVQLDIAIPPAAGAACDVKLEGTQADWASRGVVAGQYLALAYPAALHDGSLTGGGAPLSGNPLEWHGWGRITLVAGNTLTVEGMDWEVVASMLLPDMTLYPMMWTVYRGQFETVAPDGSIYTSYDEQMLVPAFRSPVAAAAAPTGQVDHPGMALYSSARGGFHSDHAVSLNEDWASMLGVWVRLGRSFVDLGVDGGASPAELLISASPIDLDNDPSGVADPLRTVYSEQRFNTLEMIDLGPGAAVQTVRGVLALPLQEGKTAVVDPTAVLPAVMTVAAGTEGVPNVNRMSGYLLPTGLGATQQVLFFAPTGAADTVGGIVVSGMPGSVPFPQQFGNGLVIEDDAVHLGGLTDMYVKSSSIIEAEADPIQLSPANPNPDNVEVLFSGTDGKVLASNTTTFYSATLVAQLETYLGLDPLQAAHLDNLVVELTDQSLVSPSSFRAVHTTPPSAAPLLAAGVRVDATLNVAGDTPANLRWRVLRTCTTSLVEPLVVVQEGADLKTVANEKKVHLDASFTFLEDPATVQVYIRILSGSDLNEGEYRVTSKAASILSLDRAVVETAAGQTYQVYTKQVVQVATPLVRVSSVELAGEQAGITVPYRHPVDVVASSFAGVNNDPTTDTCTLANVGGALTLTPTGALPSDIGVNDVVRLDDFSGTSRYYYITSMVVAPTLILDREMLPAPAASPTTHAFTIGHPSVGTADLLFMDPTYFEANPVETSDGLTVFSFVDSAGQTVQFRPSPAEKATVYESDPTSTPVVIEQTGKLSVQDIASPFLPAGVQVGDEIEFLTKVLRGTNMLDAAADALVDSIAGHTLGLKIGSVDYFIGMTGTNPLSLQSVADDINQQVGTSLQATVGASGGNKWLELASILTAEITNLGTPGILGALNLTAGSNSISATRTVDSIAYNLAADRTDLFWAAGEGTVTGVTTQVFLRISRLAQQRLYPADLVQQDTGMWMGQIRLTSYDPFEDERVTEGQQLSVAGYRSFGYDIQVDADLLAYSYSTAEKVAIQTTSIILEDDATSTVEAIGLPGVDVVVQYEHSPLARSIQEYVLSPTVRVANHNPLVRHYLPAYALMAITYTGTVGDAELLQKVSAYLGSLYPNLPLEVFDLVTILSRAGADYVEFPQQVSFLTYGPDRVVRVVRSEDVVRLSKQYHIMENLDLITLLAG
jgi:hypothetical protein